jgi:hypothetical protein
MIFGHIICQLNPRLDAACSVHCLVSSISNESHTVLKADTRQSSGLMRAFGPAIPFPTRPCATRCQERGFFNQIVDSEEKSETPSLPFNRNRHLPTTAETRKTPAGALLSASCFRGAPGSRISGVTCRFRFGLPIDGGERRIKGHPAAH